MRRSRKGAAAYGTAAKPGRGMELEILRDERLGGVDWKDLLPLSRGEVVYEVLLSLPWLGLSLVLVWVGIVSLTRMVSAASLAAASLVPILAWLMDQPTHTIAFCFVVAGFVWWTHRANVRRLLDGSELRFGSKDDA